MIKLADENKEDAPAAPTPQPAQKVSVIPKAQSLAQQSTKGKTQEDADASDKKKSAEPKPKKKEKVKKDLIHRIDQQLTKLKNKNGSKKEGSEEDEEVAAMPDEKETTDDAETTSPDEKMTDDYGLDGLSDSVK